MNKKNNVFLWILFLITTATQTTHSIFTGRAAFFVGGHLLGLYTAYRHTHQSIKQEDEKKSFVYFAKNIISEYPLIKEVTTSQEFKDAFEKLKKINS